MSQRIAIQAPAWRRFGSTVFVDCPKCKSCARLDHTVEDNGDINPSLDCPRCPFHAHVRLEGWVPLGPVERVAG